MAKVIGYANSSNCIDSASRPQEGFWATSFVGSLGNAWHLRPDDMLYHLPGIIVEVHGFHVYVEIIMKQCKISIMCQWCILMDQKYPHMLCEHTLQHLESTISINGIMCSASHLNFTTWNLNNIHYPESSYQCHVSSVVALKEEPCCVFCSHFSWKFKNADWIDLRVICHVAVSTISVMVHTTCVVPTIIPHSNSDASAA